MTDARNLQKRKPMRLKEFDYSGSNYVFFLTICARHLTNPFNDPELAREVISALLYLVDNDKIRLYCYCLMPDHLHLALSPSKGETVSHITRQFKSFTTRLGWSHHISGKLWQRSFYDHIARSDEDLVKICEYILANPVRKGLVQNPRDWKYSGLMGPLPV